MGSLLPANANKFSHSQITRIGKEWQSGQKDGRKLDAARRFLHVAPEGRQIVAHSGSCGGRCTTRNKSPVRGDTLRSPGWLAAKLPPLRRKFVLPGWNLPRAGNFTLGVTGRI